MTADNEALFFDNAEQQLRHRSSTPAKPFAASIRYGRGEATSPDMALSAAINALITNVDETIRTTHKNCWAEHTTTSHTVTPLTKNGQLIFLVTIVAHVNFWKHGG